MVPSNPCERPVKVYRSDRIDNIWSVNDEYLFLNAAPPHIGLAFTLAMWTGQRRGDLLRLPWSAYNGETIRMRQRKTGARVVFPVGASLKTLRDETPKTTLTILATTRKTA